MTPTPPTEGVDCSPEAVECIASFLEGACGRTTGKCDCTANRAAALLRALSSRLSEECNFHKHAVSAIKGWKELHDMAADDLRKYGHHIGLCDSYRPGGTCDCGYAAALARGGKT